MIMDIVLWGIGNNAYNFLAKTGLYQDDKIVALIDVDYKKWGIKIRDFIIQSPDQIRNMIYDKIIICPSQYDEIKEMLINQYMVEEDRIDNLNYFNNKIIQYLRAKYQNAHDIEAENMLDDFEKNGPSVWGSYKGRKDCYCVYRDEENHPYIMFMDKRMYFPDDYQFHTTGDDEYIENILWEQDKDSPHLYIRSVLDEGLLENGIIVDAGVREGNFALQYVERARKLYLIEPDRRWVQALEKTFRPFRDKIILCDRLLSRENDKDHISLDMFVSDKIDFLKMDIEGNEVDAILGGKRVLSKSDAACAICSYHNMSDEENIRFLMSGLGYETTVSTGYMFFLYDKYLFDHLDFRRGIVYASKKARRR